MTKPELTYRNLQCLAPWMTKPSVPLLLASADARPLVAKGLVVPSAESADVGRRGVGSSKSWKLTPAGREIVARIALERGTLVLR